MSWRNAKSIETIIKQARKAAPSVPRRKFGTIGDAAHRSRKSDHNPWLRKGGVGVVTAVDIPHDPKRGLDCSAIAAALVQSRDKRIKYIIFNGRIVSHKATWRRGKRIPAWQWRPYNGSNPHKHHLHLSVRPEHCDDYRLWPITWRWTMGQRILRLGATGTDVADLQRLLKITADGDYGPLTEKAVRAFQKSAGLTVDGEAGPKTLAALQEANKPKPKPQPRPEPEVPVAAPAALTVDAVVQAMLHTPIQREGSVLGGHTNLRAVLANFDNAVEQGRANTDRRAEALGARLDRIEKLLGVNHDDS